MHKKNGDFDIRFLTILSASLLAILALIFMVNLNFTGNTTTGATGKTVSELQNFFSDNSQIGLGQIMLFSAIILLMIILIVYIKKKSRNRL